MRRLTEAWFSFKGIDSRDMGVMIKYMPTRTIPGRNITRKRAAGADGSYIYGDHTFGDARVQLECDFRDTSRLPEALAWLTGEGELIFSDEPGLIYDASIDKEYSRSSISPRMDGQRLTISWVCKPFRRMTPEADPIRMTAAGTIRNAGTVYSRPRITIDADGDFSMSINTQTMFFSGVEDGIILDCELMDAFTADGALLANDQVAGEFFRLDEGANIITWLVEAGSEVRSVTIEPRWRCI